ncbi:hypothetical protein PAMP_010065 [Pampus punctatissimus]
MEVTVPRGGKQRNAKHPANQKEGEEEEEVDPGGHETGHAGDESRQAGCLAGRQPNGLGSQSSA